MYSATLSITNLDDLKRDVFAAAAYRYIQELKAVPELHVGTHSCTVPGTRGELVDFSNIVLASVSSGVFIAVYTLVKDFFDRYANAEATPRFQDGSSITLKYLTQQEAEKLIQDHLRHSSKAGSSQ